MVAPTITFRQFTVSASDPAGERAQNTNAAFVKQLSTTVGSELDFGINNITNSGVNSSTLTVVGHMDASGSLTTQLFNMKFWLPYTQAFNGTVRFNLQKSSGWLQNNVVDNSSLETVPTTLPSSGNVLRQDGSGIINGSGDAQVTEWLYLSVFTGTDNTVGLKGGGGQSSFRYRFTADYY